MMRERLTRLREGVRDAWRLIRPGIAVDGDRPERGVALLMVLVTVAVMAAFSTEFSYNARVNLRMASNLEREVQAYYHARSSIEVARMVIRGQKLADDMLSLAAQFMPSVKNQNVEMWSFACKFVEIYNTGKVNLLGFDLFDLSGREGIGVKHGSFECVADAEDGRVNVNFVETIAAKRTLFKHLFGYLQGPRPEGTGWSKDDRDRADLLLNIIDWVDPDQRRTDIDPNGNFTEGSGSEDFAYSRYDHEAKNAKFDTVEELRLVDGMDDETFCDIRDKVTVYSTERLNVNTADLGLLKAVVCEAMTPENQAVACGSPFGGQLALTPMDIVGEYLELCRGIKKMLFTAPFANANAFVNFFKKLPPELAPLVQVNGAALKPVVGVKSRVIRVQSTGKVGRTEKRITAIIDTSTGKYVYWREE
jgi:type II secretory pathway component PulK